jgi:hypothetical protein
LKRNVTVSWRAWGGFYKLKYVNTTTEPPLVTEGDVMTFDHYWWRPGIITRTGWESWVCFPNYRVRMVCAGSR